MAGESLTVTINGREYVSKEALKAGKGLDNLGKKANTLSKTTKSLKLGAVALVAAFVALQRGVSELVGAYAEQEAAETSLASAIKATGMESEISMSAMTDYASALQNVTLYGDEAILAGQALLQSLANLNQEGLQKATPAVLDFATAMGLDVKTAMTLVGKTLGSSTNALARYGIQVDANASKEEKLAQLTAELESKFGGMAQAAANTSTGAFTQLTNATGDLKEALGGVIADGLAPMARETSGLVVSLTNWINRQREAKKILDDIDETGSTSADSLEDLRAALANNEAEIRVVEAVYREAGLEIEDFYENLIDEDKALYQVNESLKAQIDYLVAMEAAAFKAAAMTEQYANEAAEMARQRAQERAEAEARQADMDLLAEWYAKTEEGQRKATEDLIKYFETFQQVGRVLPILEMLRASLEPITEAEPEAPSILKGLLQDANEEMERQILAKEELARLDQLMFEAVKNGDDEWLSQLEDIYAQMEAIAGVASGIETPEPVGPRMSDSEQVLHDIKAWDAMEQRMAEEAQAEKNLNMGGLFDTLTSELGGFGGQIVSLTSQFGAWGLVLAGVQEIMSAAMGILGPAIEGILKPLSLVLRVIGVVIGGSLAPVLEGLTPIIELLAEVLVWVVNWVIRPVSNAIISVFNMVLNTITWVANGFIDVYNMLVRKSKEKEKISYRNLDAGWMEEISMTDPAVAGSYEADYGSAYGGSYGGGTTVQQAPPINIYLNFNSQVIGAGGMEEVGAYVAQALEEHGYAGGAITFAEV